MEPAKWNFVIGSNTKYSIEGKVRPNIFIVMWHCIWRGRFKLCLLHIEID